jgi:hypothetical protein
MSRKNRSASNARKWMDDVPARDQRSDPVQGVLQRRRDAEVAPAAADRPEQVRVLPGARADHAAVREDHVRRLQVVERQAVLRHQPAQSPAERQAGNSRAPDDAAGRREAMQLRLAVELSPQDAALGAHGARGDVHQNALHRRQVDHHARVDRRAARDVVAAAADRDLEAQRSRQGHGIDDVRDALATRDQGRTPVDQPVVHPAGVVVAGVGRPQQLAGERRSGARRGCCGR